MKKNLLKKDLFGEVWEQQEGEITSLLRDTEPAHWSISWLARALLRREARALAALNNIDGVPRVIKCDGTKLVRSFLPGQPMYLARPQNADYFRSLAKLLRRMHREGVVHNDLAKEPNILVTPEDFAAFIDFQLAAYSSKRGRLFRAAAREDIRHLLKHKRTYRPDLLTRRERNILNSPSLVSRLWMSIFKPVYLFVTRKLFRWADREGAADRGKFD